MLCQWKDLFHHTGNERRKKREKKEEKKETLIDVPRAA
jgi:hypothetical protein